jgi:hypothetical protein
MHKHSKNTGWWSSVYSEEDLTRSLQTFKKESPLVNLVRLALLLANVNNVLLIIYIYNLHRLTMFFTNWTLLITCIYLAVAIAAKQY